MAKVTFRQNAEAKRQKNQKLQLEAALAILLIRWANKAKRAISSGDKNLSKYKVEISKILATFNQKVKRTFVQTAQKQIKLSLNSDEEQNINDLFTTWSNKRALFVAVTILATMTKRLKEFEEETKNNTELAKAWFLDTQNQIKDVIATNEVQTAAEVSKDLTFKGIEKTHDIILKKIWITVGDERVRPAHMEAHGQTVRYDANFIVGGEELAYPKDSRGSLWNIINCRCISYAIR